VNHARLQRDFFYIDFLGYGTHGNFIVMDSPTWKGYHEFPLR
jgi:hypothetical protein